MASSIVPAGHQVFANSNSGRAYLQKNTQQFQVDVVGLSIAYRLPVVATRVGDTVTLMFDEINEKKSAIAGTLTVVAGSIPASVRPTAGISFQYIVSIGGTPTLGGGYLAKDGSVAFLPSPVGGNFTANAAIRSTRFSFTYSLISSHFRP